MPKLLSYTPAWLSRPSPGFDLFSSNGKKLSHEPERRSIRGSTNGVRKPRDCLGPRRTLAHRGTEVFVVVDNTIRWSDLCMLKEEWEGQEQDQKQIARSIEDIEQKSFAENPSNYRVLKVPVSEQICQLIPSPNGKLLAVVTSHTVHIAILPESTHLDQPDTGPIRLKTYMLGPTTHVLSQSPVIDAIWHPLGVNGSCIVTITQEAVVRVWELSIENRWSFDSPALAIDLKKLQHGTSAEDDFSAAKIGTNRGFSLDALDMVVAAACFGGTGSSGESGWCSMTLWIAMVEGDVYALCPLLPSKWQPPSSLVPCMTVAVTAEKLSMEEDDEMRYANDHQHCDQQYTWLAEVDRQDPILVIGEYDTSPETLVYDRPSQPGPIPRLQGPFNILPDGFQDDLELSGIYVVASRLGIEDLLNYEEDEGEGISTISNGLSTSIICLLTRSGRVCVCLDLEGVKAEWLPSKKSKSKSTFNARPQPELILLEALDTLDASSVSEIEWPMFTPDINSDYSVFITHSCGVCLLSLDPWIGGLESELQSNASEGSEFRLGVLLKSRRTLRERILQIGSPNNEDNQQIISAPIVLNDSDLGCFLLITCGDQPHAIVLDAPKNANRKESDSNSQHDYEPDLRLLTLGPPRSAYQPPQSLWAKSSLSHLIDTHVQNRHKKALKEEIRLSTSTLELITEAHRTLSHETHQLGIAAADLFRRCERLQEELHDQIRRTNEVAGEIERLNDEDADDYGEEEKVRGAAKIERRLQAAKDRQEDIVARYEALRNKLARAGGRDLSDKEQALVAEVKKLATSILEAENDADDGEEHKSELLERYDEARALAEDLIAQAKDASEGHDASTETNGAFKVPPDIRKNKVADVMGLLERESALVDAAQERLERLTFSVQP